MNAGARYYLDPLGIWALIATLAILNGTFRELVIIPQTGTELGHQLSTLILLVIIFIVTYGFFTRTTHTYTPIQLITIGVAWTLMTVIFEFIVGFLEGTPVSVTIAQYNVLAGRVWILVPFTLLLAPLIMTKLTQSQPGGTHL